MNTNKEDVDTFDQEINNTVTEPYEIITNNSLKTVTIISDQQIIYSNYIPNVDSSYEISLSINESDCNKQINYATMANVPFTDTTNKYIIHIESNDNNILPTIIATPATPIYKCDICSNIYKQKTDLETHKKTHESTSSCNNISTQEKKTYICKKCNHFFTNRFDLIVHEHIHQPMNINLTCVNSSKQYTKNKLTYKVLNNKLNHVCDTCNRKFKTLTLLNVHKQTHNKQNRNFICSICDKGFNMESHLKAHINMHTGENKLLNRIISKTDKLFEVDTYPYKCRYCDQFFETKTSLQLHIKSIHK